MASIPFRIFNANVRVKSLNIIGTKSVTATASLTRRAHAGRTSVFNAAAGFTATLPASTGSGDKYRVLVGTTLTSNTLVVRVANSTDVMVGGVFLNDIGDSSAATADFSPTASTSDTITMTASLGSGKRGDWVEFEDFAAGFWAVHGVFQGVTDPTSPFSAGV